MAKINLATSDFKTVKEGQQVLTIKSAKALPSGRPSMIEVVFEDNEGATILSNYKFDNSKSMFVFTLLVQNALGVTEDTFDTDNLVDLVGKRMIVEVKHTVKPSTKNPGQDVTFANISRIIGVDNSTETYVEGPTAPSLDGGLE